MRRMLVSVLVALLLLASVIAAISANGVPLPEVSLESDSFWVAEDAGQVALNVTLGASSTLTVTTEYETSGRTAIAGKDYLTATGTLTFTPGITLQTALITVLDDDLPEPDEAFFLVLTNTHNAVLGLYPTATITITDDGDPYVVLLPLVMKRWPPIPYDPTLNAINNSDGDGTYWVSWIESPTRRRIPTSSKKPRMLPLQPVCDKRAQHPVWGAQWRDGLQACSTTA